PDTHLHQARRRALHPQPQKQADHRPASDRRLGMSGRKVAIVTDSTADLPPQLVKARAITVVPLTLHFEGRSLLDGVDIRPSEFYRKLPNVTPPPTTSQPASGLARVLTRSPSPS